MKLAVCLLRVSSDRQLQEGQGIEVQKRTNDYFANNNGFAIVRYFTEHFSGRKADRQVVEEVMEFIEQSNGDISALIVSQIDRFTRAGADVYLFLQKRLRALGVELLDASGVIQKPQNTLAALGFEYEWSVRSPSRLTETILAEQANAEATQILTRCIGGQIQTAKAGYQYRSAEFGYRNEKTVTEDGRKRTIMAREEPEASWVQEMFRLRAEDQLTDWEICNRLNASGYRSRIFRRYDPVTREVVGQGGGVPLEPKQLQKHLKRTAYCGIRYGKWTHQKPIYLPRESPRLVSIETFNRANRGSIYIQIVDGEIILSENIRPKANTIETDTFILRHVIRCPHCSNQMKASFSRGKSGKAFGYYHCSRGHKYLGVKTAEFEGAVAKMVESVTFKKKLLGLLKEVIRDVWVKQYQADEQSKYQIREHIAKLKQRQESLLGKIERSLSEAVQLALEKEYDELNSTIKQAYSQLAELEDQNARIDQYFDTIKRAVEHPQNWLLAPQSKQSLQKAWGFMFEEFPTWSNVQDRTPRLALPFRFLASSQEDENRLVELVRSESNTLIKHIRMFSEQC